MGALKDAFKVEEDRRAKVMSKPPLIPCLGEWEHTTESSDFDCGYELADGFACEDCIVNGGRGDPRTGEDYGMIQRFKDWCRRVVNKL